MALSRSGAPRGRFDRGVRGVAASRGLARKPDFRLADHEPSLLDFMYICFVCAVLLDLSGTHG